MLILPSCCGRSAQWWYGSWVEQPSSLRLCVAVLLNLDSDAVAAGNEGPGWRLLRGDVNGLRPGEHADRSAVLISVGESEFSPSRDLRRYIEGQANEIGDLDSIEHVDNATHLGAPTPASSRTSRDPSAGATRSPTQAIVGVSESASASRRWFFAEAYRERPVDGEMPSSCAASTMVNPSQWTSSTSSRSCSGSCCTA